jgi:DNA polymerase-3 subunit beta
MPAIKDETGQVTLTRDQTLALFRRPLFAVSTETTRFYLNGILLHDVGADLVAVGTDGHRLARVTALGCAGLSADRRLIAPLAAVKIIIKLLTRGGVEEPLTLRRSGTLLEVKTAGFRFVTKLIDAEYPSYERVVPAPSGNSVIVSRADLALALKRIEAVAPEVKTAPLAGLAWAADEPALHVAVPGWPDLANDPIAAEVSGAGRVAFKISHGIELLEAFKGERVRIDSDATSRSPIHITNPDDLSFLVIQMPCTWSVETLQAA